MGVVWMIHVESFLSLLHTYHSVLLIVLLILNLKWVMWRIAYLIFCPLSFFDPLRYLLYFFFVLHLNDIYELWSPDWLYYLVMHTIMFQCFKVFQMRRVLDSQPW